MQMEGTWASMHFKLSIVDPLFWAVSKFLEAPELMEADISASYKQS